MFQCGEVLSGKELESVAIDDSFGSIVLHPGGDLRDVRGHCPCVRSEKQSLALSDDATQGAPGKRACPYLHSSFEVMNINASFGRSRRLRSAIESEAS
jgi:hypothetical protein